MKHDEFRRIVDHDLSGLVWDEAHRTEALRRMNGEERPIVKKKAYTALILAAVLIFGALTALAAGGMSSIIRLFGYDPDEQPYYSYHIIDEADLVKPVTQPFDSQWLDCEVSEMYWAEDALFVTISARAKDPSMVAVGKSYFTAGRTIHYQGKDMRWWDFRQQEGLTILQHMIPIRPGDAAPFTCREFTINHEEHDGTNSIIVYRFMNLSEEETALLQTGGTITLPMEINLYDGQKMSVMDEESTSISFTFPPMTMHPGPVHRAEW